MIEKFEFIVNQTFLVDKRTLYATWMDSNGHTKMTGEDAIIYDQIGAVFSTRNGYISGKNLELIPGTYILQSWRTGEFDEDQEDSSVEIFFEERDGYTTLTIKHSNLMKKDAHYQQQWRENYFAPMRRYFESF